MLLVGDAQSLCGEKLQNPQNKYIYLRRIRNKTGLKYENAYCCARSRCDARFGWMCWATGHDHNDDDEPDYYAGADSNTHTADNDTASYGWRRLRRSPLIASFLYLTGGYR